MEKVQAKQKKELKTFESNKRIALKKIKGTAGKGKKGKEALAQGEAEWKETLQQLILQHDQQLKSLLGDGTSTNTINSTSNSISNSSDAAADGGANPSPADHNQDQDHDDTMNNTKTHNTDTKTRANTGKEKEEDQQRAIREKALDKKMRKKKNALAKQKAREEQIAKEMAEAPNPRQMEIDAIMELYLQGAKLEIEEVRADGNCLYRAIAKQMELMMKIRNGGGGEAGGGGGGGRNF